MALRYLVQAFGRLFALRPGYPVPTPKHSITSPDLPHPVFTATFIEFLYFNRVIEEIEKLEKSLIF